MSDAGKVSQLDFAPVSIPALRTLGPAKALGVILAVSGAVFAFLVWLVYFKPAAGYSSQWIGSLPAVNATFNALSSIFLVAGYGAVRRRRYGLHVRLMFAALGSSALFLISYVVYHTFHGHTEFTGTGGLVRSVYFFVLITHIVLSAVVVPMILTSLYLALAGKMASHRRVSRFTFPIWLYVSVTGVLIFVMLRAFSA